MKKNFFLFGLIVLTILSVSCKLDTLTLHNVASGIVSGQSDPEGEQDPDLSSYILSGVFTVNSSGKQVHFSKGALYWNGGSFKLEENQYDFRTLYNSPSVINGEYKANNTDIADGENGLFYWAKDVAETYALNYDSTESTSDTFALASGGAIAGLDVLSADEWMYLIGFDSEADTRQDAASKHGLATITTEQGASVKGLVLLPDSWTMPDGCNWTAGKNSGWTTNEYDATQWESMEQTGAVFLPAMGYRRESSVGDVGGYGYWWYSTPKSDNNKSAGVLCFMEFSGAFSDHSYRNNGHGVRLVATVRN